MRIEKQGENVYKIYISEIELILRRIDINSLDTVTPAVEQLAKDIDKMLREEYNFDFNDIDVMIETSIHNYGLLMIISKTENPFNYMTVFSQRIENKLIFEFENMFDLVKFSKVVKTCSGSLVRYKRKYYLIIDSYKKSKKFDILIADYGRVKDTDFFEAKLYEYGEVLIENSALEVLRVFY